MLIPFIYNLFKRHPGCMVMIQRMAPEDDEVYRGESPQTSRICDAQG
jgi:U3 small nucleolar RNA-associated protein 19